MRLIDADAWIKQLSAEVDNADVPDEQKDYNLQLINEIESRLHFESGIHSYQLADCSKRTLNEANNLLASVIKLENVQKQDSQISATGTLLRGWEYMGKPMLLGGITGMFFIMVIVLLLHLIL